MDAFVMRRGGGGAAMNFTVVGGTTQPANPKENTIWVNTDREITVWTFAWNEPESPAEGMIWFILGGLSSIEINAFKENELEIRFLSASQYVSGQWVNVDVKAFCGGAWIENTLWLYKSGNEFETVTGGWAYSKTHVTSYYVTYPSGFSKGNTIQIRFPNAGNRSCTAMTNKKINVSGASTLRINFTTRTISGGTYFYSSWGLYSGDFDSATLVASGRVAVGEQTIDISGLEGEYYVGCNVRVEGNTYGTLAFNEVEVLP